MAWTDYAAYATVYTINFRKWRSEQHAEGKG